jgi:hypothetical protein
LKLTETEKKIIKNRLIGLSFSQLPEKELRFTADQIILNAAAISGCPTPVTDFFADVLTDQINEFINEFGFHELTIKEIVLAFQLNTKGGLRHPSGLEIDKIHFSGNCFNIDFLSGVLSNYLTLRNHLDRKLENFLDGY